MTFSWHHFQLEMNPSSYRYRRNTCKCFQMTLLVLLGCSGSLFCKETLEFMKNMKNSFRSSEWCHIMTLSSLLRYATTLHFYSLELWKYWLWNIKISFWSYIAQYLKNLELGVSKIWDFDHAKGINWKKWWPTYT